LAWSPGGSQIAYFRVYLSGTSTNRYALETIGMNGGRAKVSESSVQFDPALSWAADGRLLYAYRKDPRSELNDFGIWSVRVNEKTGEPQGEPKQLTKGVGRIGGLSVTADGKRLILWRVNAFTEVFLTEIDREEGRLKIPRRLTLDEHPNIATAWTPDSRAVLFFSNRNGTYKLFRQGIDQSVPEVLVEGRGIGIPRLNPDGTHVLYLVEPNSEEPAHMVSVMEVPLEGGSPRLILRKPSVTNIQCAESPSKLCLLSTQEGFTARFSSFDPESGNTQEFASFQASDDLNWSLSPDGSQLALILYGPERKITFMKVSDKSTYDVTLNEWPRLNAIDWTSDGKSVFVSSWNASGSVMLAVEPNGNRRVLLQADKSMRYWAIVPSPDGRYGALDAVTGENNVWMVENF
jgi:Tol biopolymer transport system component